jgi:hypothetical protein
MAGIMDVGMDASFSRCPPDIEFQRGCSTLALNSPALSDPALSGPTDSSCWAVSGAVPNWQARHDPMASSSDGAGTTPKTARLYRWQLGGEGWH